MTFTYTDAQKAAISAKYITGDIPGAYREAARIAQYEFDATGKRLEEHEKASVTWLIGAAQVNEGNGPYSDFIRSYTATQFRLREGPGADNGLNRKIQTHQMRLQKRLYSEIF